MTIGSDSKKSPLDGALGSLRSPVLVVGVLSVFLNLLTFVSPIFMLQVYDRVLTSRNETTLAMLMAIAIVLLLAYGLTEKFRHEILVRAAMMFDRAVAGPGFDAALQASLRAKGGQQAQVMRDVDVLRELIAGHGILTLLDAPWAPVFLLVCFSFHPAIGMVASVGALLIFALAFINDRLTSGALVKASTANIASLDRLAGALRNAEAIVGLGMAPALRARWMRKHHEAVVANVEANERGGSVLAVSKFVRAVLQIAILATGGWLVIHQEISGGVMFAASLMMGKALGPVEQAVQQWKSFVGARSALHRLQTVFRAFPAPAERMHLPDPKGTLAVENLTVVAPGGGAVLVRNVSFDLNAGEVLAIVGPTGSGKSTLARSIVGAWPIAAGAVRLDGNELAHWDADQLGAHLGYLPQDVELFEGTVAENIARFRGGRDGGVVGAATLAHAHEMIQRLPDGYETQVGEDGVSLSGGQRQRVGLARAIHGNPSLIVLDEPNSNLDGEGDIALVEALAALKQAGKTVVVVTHKPNLLGEVDKMLIMQNGIAYRFGTRQQILPLILGPSAVPSQSVAA